MEREYAPVIIPTLCRYEHFKRCVESLQRNPWAKYTDLYIGLDYPAKEGHYEGYEKIKAYLEGGIGGFANVVVLKHGENKGSFENSELLRLAAAEKHDRFVFSEDDNEFSANYLEYMNKCLDEYEKDENILAVAGFQFPFHSDRIKGTVFTNNIYFVAFGYGSWNRKIMSAREEMTVELFRARYKNIKYMRYLYRQGANQYCNFVKAMLGYIPGFIEKDRVLPYDLCYGFYMAAQGKKVIFPTASKVKNWGYDGSGEHCDSLIYDKEKPITHRNFGTECQELDENEGFELVEEKELSQQELNDIMSEFFVVPGKEIIRTKAAYYLSRVIGIDKARKLIHGVKHK